MCPGCACPSGSFLPVAVAAQSTVPASAHFSCRRQNRTQRALRELQPKAPTSWFAFPPECQTILHRPALFILGSDSRTSVTDAPPPHLPGQGTAPAFTDKFRFVSESVQQSKGGCDATKKLP